MDDLKNMKHLQDLLKEAEDAAKRESIKAIIIILVAGLSLLGLGIFIGTKL